MNRLGTIFPLLLLSRAAESQSPGASGSNPPPGGPVGAVFNYLSMAGTSTAADFQPLSQSERNRLYLKSLANPIL